MTDDYPPVTDPLRAAAQDRMYRLKFLVMLLDSLADIHREHRDEIAAVMRQLIEEVEA